MKPTAYENYIALSRYARWIPEKGRRETWEETVSRYLTFWENHLAEAAPEVLPKFRERLPQIEGLMRRREVLGSMRALMTAGEALERDHVAGYNCAYVDVDDPRAFDEAMYVLMCGTGVGFSVERRYVDKLPTVAETFHETDSVIVVADSKIGWASAFRELVSLLYAGKVPKWDMSKVRPAGARLKTFGGRASGPEPLESLFKFTVSLFQNAAGRKLRPLECHDLMCKVGEIVVVGGVRRSAMISLSDLGEESMRVAKSGAWWEANSHRALANNSAVYEHKPDMHTFLREWQSLIDSRSGERGIFNREACTHISRRHLKRETDHDFGTNPCSEIILRPKQFCNLTEAVVRASDNAEKLKEKVEVAAILGTLQATLTDFRYLRKVWKKNCEDERLLGLSLTGIMDNKHFGTPSVKLRDDLDELRRHAEEVNREWAEALGINSAAAITCVKPSGTVSQLVNAASGIHPRHSQHYIRRVRQDLKDPLTDLMRSQGVPGEPERFSPDSTWVFEFPVEAPKDCTTREEVSAISQLKLWLCYQQAWCEHKPSITVNVQDHEWLEVGDWVYKHFDWMSGVSFLPYDGGTYKQAPYEAIDKETFGQLKAEFPKVDFSKLGEFEQDDQTKGSQELACTGGSCELA